MNPRSLITTCIALALVAGPGLSAPDAPQTGFGKAATKAKPIPTQPLPQAPALDRSRGKVDSKGAGKALAPSLRIDSEVVRRLEPSEREPQLDAVESAYDQFKQARSDYQGKAISYRRQIRVCSGRSYSSSEQAEAGCEGSDTVAECSQKLLRRCTSAAATRFWRAQQTLARRAQGLRSAVDEVTGFGG